MSLDSPHLKPRQLSSIKHTQSPQLILAGAGTGKTTTITAKIAIMVEKENIDPSQILALTFSREAARNMCETVEKLDVRTINEHIKSIYDEGELSPDATIRKFRIVQTEGGRQVLRNVNFYDLDVISAVGYRVHSHHSTTSQCPPLSAPMRRRRPFFLRFPRCFCTADSLIFSSTDNSFLDTAGFSLISCNIIVCFSVSSDHPF